MKKSDIINSLVDTVIEWKNIPTLLLIDFKNKTWFEIEEIISNAEIAKSFLKKIDIDKPIGNPKIPEQQVVDDKEKVITTEIPEDQLEKLRSEIDNLPHMIVKIERHLEKMWFWEKHKRKLWSMWDETTSITISMEKLKKLLREKITDYDSLLPYWKDWKIRPLLNKIANHELNKNWEKLQKLTETDFKKSVEYDSSLWEKIKQIIIKWLLNWWEQSVEAIVKVNDSSFVWIVVENWNPDQVNRYTKEYCDNLSKWEYHKGYDSIIAWDKRELFTHVKPINTNNLQFVDKAKNCFKFDAVEITCPDKLTNINNIPIQESGFTDNI